MGRKELIVRHSFPKRVVEIIRRLEENGYEAYVVGGAVRDILLGTPPDDYDITTSATPEEVIAVFGEKNCYPTGLAHGTVTVVKGGKPFEVTTFRIDGDYADARHPDEVRFTRSLEEDVKRRDFTVNAMAVKMDGTVLDFCGGAADIRKKLLRTVGDPATRFGEDALRILRALRFASEYGFAIEEETKNAIHAQKEDLLKLSAERIWKELSKLLCGPEFASVMREYFDVFSVILPEIAPMQGFEQHNPHHCFDVLEHTLVAMANIPADPVLRLTMLLHDVGKPACFTMDDAGVGHFLGHQKLGAEMAEQILRRLKVDSETRETVVLLVRDHDITMEPTPKIARRRLSRYGEKTLRKLLLVKRADNAAHSEMCRYRLGELDDFEKILDQVLKERQCFSFSMLKIDGKDLMENGFQAGPFLGETLRKLLNAVIDGDLPNEKEVLLARALELKDGKNKH